MLYGKVVHCRIFIDARVSLTAIQRACKCRRKLADETVVRQSKVAEFEGEADKVGEEVWGMNTAIYENGAVDVGMGES